MLPAAFIERSRMGKMIYEVADGRLEISGRRKLRKAKVTLDLTDLSPSIQRGRMEHRGQAAFHFVIGALFSGLTFALLFQSRFQLAVILIPAEVSAMFAVIAFREAARWKHPLEVVRFKSRMGGTAFDMFKESEYAGEFETFVGRLRESIRKANDPSRLDVVVPSEPDPTPGPSPENYWRFSMICGASALYVPIFEGFEGMSGRGSIMIFFLTVGGLIFAVYSCLRREAGWPFAVLGAILAILPAFLAKWF